MDRASQLKKISVLKALLSASSKLLSFAYCTTTKKCSVWYTT